MHNYLSININICMFIWLSTYIYIYICMYLSICLSIYIRMHLYSDSHVYLCMYIYIYISYSLILNAYHVIVDILTDERYNTIHISYTIHPNELWLFPLPPVHLAAHWRHLLLHQVHHNGDGLIFHNFSQNKPGNLTWKCHDMSYHVVSKCRSVWMSKI